MSSSSSLNFIKRMNKVTVNGLTEEKGQKKLDKKIALEIYPKDKQFDLRGILKIRKLKPRFTIKENQKEYLFVHSPNLEQAKIIFEFFLEEKNYLTECFVKPIAIIAIERLNYLYKKTKVYMSGEKKENLEESWIELLKREEKNRLIGSAIFNLARLHQNQIALSDVSLSNIYRKKSDSLAVFGLPSQLRKINKKEEGYDEFVIFLNNVLLNKMITKKEIDVYIQHYLKSFDENNFELETEKKKLLDLFENYYIKYYKQTSN